MSIISCSTRLALASMAWLAAGASAALAHTGHGTDGFTLGLLHPLTGTDHLLAMLAVGLWASFAPARLIWAAPAGFVVGMATGGVAGFAGFVLPGMEFTIVTSVILFGVLAFVAQQASGLIAFGLAAAFGAFHGMAHGAEMPAAVTALTYAAGVLLATIALHAGGVLFGLGVRRASVEMVARIAGGGVAAAGLVLAIV